jgi:hypothetical protein
MCTQESRRNKGKDIIMLWKFRYDGKRIEKNRLAGHVAYLRNFCLEKLMEEGQARDHDDDRRMTLERNLGK